MLSLVFFVPPTGSSVTFDANCNFILGFGRGQIAVLEGVTSAELKGVPGGSVLNQNWARKGDSDISVTACLFLILSSTLIERTMLYE